MNLHPSFTLIQSRELPELGGALHEMEHKATGAKLCWLQRPDDNKTFAVAFTTLPEDSTGVFHILEHSVLCGSEKYPVKEPFVELLKNSMNTFLNAMTFPDKTCYPVSSRNDKDFLNLMRVYMDAAFCPAIYTKPEIFCQEGWHYEFDENGTPSYKGVVFNEMKGAYASPDDLMYEGVMAMLFPDTCYRFSSGGDPAVIPDLTYENFVNAHRRFYSPSNSFILLDGDVDLDAVLTILEEEYLSRFPRGERIAPPAMQKAVNAGEKTIAYELGQDEDPASRWRVAWGNVIGDFRDRQTTVAMQILAGVLCAGNHAPLTKCILEKGLAEDVSMHVEDGMQQHFAVLDVQNCRQENLETIEQTLRAELERLAGGGLDRQQVLAQMANMEFRMRERDYGGMPRGLLMGLNMLDTWLYGGDPIAKLEVGDLFTQLRQKLEEGWFEELIRKLLLENDHTAKLILEPSHTAGDVRRQAEQARLDAEAALWIEEQKQALVDQKKRVQAWQESEDSAEDLAKLPRLELSDISAEPEVLPIEATRIGEIPVLKHEIACGGIVYTNLYFDVKDLDEAGLSQASLLCALMGRLPTATSSVQELATRRKLLCGMMHFYIQCMSLENHPEDAPRFLTVSFSALEQNLTAATELVMEILTTTRFDDENDVMEILRQSRTGLMQQIIMSGSSVASGRVSAQTSLHGVVEDSIGGYAFYTWLKSQEEQENHQALLDGLKESFQRVFRLSRLTVSVTGNPDAAAETVCAAVSSLPEGALGETAVIKPWGKRAEGIAIPADIAFAVKGSNMLDHGGKYDGVIPLASRIISLGYLWNVIRVQGGAYGTGMRIQSAGGALCSSYRDPSAARSLEMYNGSADFLRNAASGDLTGFIIGAVSDDSPVLTPRMMGTVADRRYWMGVDAETLRQRRQQLISATAEDLYRVADVLEKTIAEGGICVVGGQKQLDECGLDTILTP